MRYFLFILMGAVTLWAHPHAFIDISIVVKSEGDRIAEVREKWVYDEMTSMTLLMEFDGDGNGVLDETETAYVRENYLDAIIAQGYFNHVTVGGKTVATPPARFDMVLENGRIAYLFIFDYSKVTPALPLAVSFYDDENFVAFDLKNEGVKLIPERNDLQAKAVLKDYVFTLKVDKP